MLRYIADYFVARTVWDWVHRPPRPRPPEPRWVVIGHRIANLMMLAGLVLIVVVFVWAFIASSL